MFRPGAIDGQELLDGNLGRGAARAYIRRMADQDQAGGRLPDELPKIAVRTPVDVIHLPDCASRCVVDRWACHEPVSAMATCNGKRNVKAVSPSFDTATNEPPWALAIMLAM